MNRIKQVLTLVICGLFIAAGAVNQGFSGFFMSLPFVVIFIYTLKTCSLKAKASSIVVVISLITVLAWNHEENTIIYPWIGDEFVASCGWKAVQYQQGYAGYSYETLMPKDAEIEEQYLVSERAIPCDIPWELTRVFVLHPDLGTSYYPVFSIAGEEATISRYQLNDAFKLQKLKHSHISSSYELQSDWTYNLSLLMMWPALPIYLLTSVIGFWG